MKQNKKGEINMTVSVTPANLIFGPRTTLVRTDSGTLVDPKTGKSLTKLQDDKGKYAFNNDDGIPSNVQITPRQMDQIYNVLSPDEYYKKMEKVAELQIDNVNLS
jgi:hypothetical protein